MTLQDQINALPSGGTLNAPGEFAENIVINKSLTLIGAKIVSPNADPAISIPPGTRDVTLRNCELTGSGTQIHAILEIGLSSMTNLADVPTNITIDQCDIHGQLTQEVQRGVAANGANVIITNSKIHEIHGQGYDTQAICCWNGPGPFKINNNFLEASGENVMFGGSPSAIPNLIPSDIEFRFNRVSKPLTWYPIDPSYAGIHWSVKNLFELKNARRVVIEGNIFENNWTDAQAGWAIQFTPRPSDSGAWAVVEDVQFINNVVRNSDQGINFLGADQAPAPTDVRLKRVRVANNLFESIRATLFTITNGADSVTLENNTAVHGGNIISSDYAPSTNLIFRNNIVRHNLYGIFGSGHSIGNDSINYYFPASIIAGNLIVREVDAPSNIDQLYPAGNSYPSTMAETVDAAYKLLTAWKAKGTNGTDSGCNIDTLNTALAGTPSSTPVPGPTPIPTPTPPTTKKVAWPKTEGKQDIVLAEQWTLGYRMKRNLSGDYAEFEKVK